MKKLLTILFALLLLAACGTKGYSQLSDGSDVIYTTPTGEFTRNDLYKSLKLASEDAVETDIVNKIAELENVDTSSVEEECEEIISMYQSMGAEYYIVYQYGSLDAFRKAYIAEGLVTKLCEAYVTEKFDEFVAEDKPVNMQLASFETEEAANKLIEDVNNGSTFDMAALNNGYESDTTAQVCLDTSSTLDLYIKQYLNETTTTGLSTVITSVSSTTDADGNATTKNTYYVLNILSRDVNDFKDAYIELKNDAIEEDEVKNYYFEKHEIEFYDQDIYEMMKAEYEVLE